MKFLPGVPYAHTRPALGFRANVQGYIPARSPGSPFSTVLEVSSGTTSSRRTTSAEMLRFVVRRLLLLVPILLGLSILVFVWIRALPGSPAEALLGERATPELVAADQRAVRARRADLRAVLAVREDRRRARLRVEHRHAPRRSPRRSRSASRRRSSSRSRRCSSRSVFGIPLGFLAAKRYGTVIDHASLFVSLIGISIPIFFLALILKYVFAVRLGWFPSVGRIDVLIESEHPRTSTSSTRSSRATGRVLGRASST